MRDRIKLIQIMAIKDTLKNVANNKKQKKVGENILALTLMNGVNLLAPFVLIPYLIRVLGAEYYGIYIFAWTFIGYFLLVVNYGYDFSATKDISIHKGDNQYISKLFYTVTASRLIFALASLMVLLLCVAIVPQFNKHSILILCGVGVFIGQSFYPTWIFQGMEEMKFITIITLVTRIIPIVFIFIFVKGISDYVYITLFQSIGYIVGGLGAFYLAIKRYKLVLYIPKMKEIFFEIKKGWFLFLSTIGISMYRETNVLILGFMTNNYVLVGYYGLADKFLRLFQMIASPLSQALFPHFGRNFAENKKLAFQQFMKASKYYTVFLALMAIIVFCTCDEMIRVYLGQDFPQIATDIRILTIVIVVGGLNYLFGIVGLVNIGLEKQFTIFVFIAGLINILISTLLAKSLGDMGSSIALSSAESVLFMLIIIQFNCEKDRFTRTLKSEGIIKNTI